MEEEGPVNFKALRAKFQEEALLAQAKSSRPAVAEKPKHVPPPGGHYSSVVSSINTATENKAPVVPRVIFRDGLRLSGGKRPHSFPPLPKQTSPPSKIGNGGNTIKQSFKDLHLPLVLPGPPVKAWKVEISASKEHNTEAEPPKDVLSQTKIRRKGLLLPFKSHKVSKACVENRDEPTYADLTTRPASAPGELLSLEGDVVSLQGEGSLSNADSPTSPDTSGDSENRFISTLERAKRKLSCRQLLITTRPKNVPSPENTTLDKKLPSPPKGTDNTDRDLPVPPQLFIPHLACISARPFFKANSVSRKAALDKKFGKDKLEHKFLKTAEASTASGPPKKPLPDLTSIGQPPVKPPRPPAVDLSRYSLSAGPEVSLGPRKEVGEARESENGSHSHPVLDAPGLPDFEKSGVETTGAEALDISSEVETLDFASFDLPTPPDFGVCEFEDVPPDLSGFELVQPASCEFHEGNLINNDLKPHNPDNFADLPKLSELPEPLCQNGDGIGAHPPNAGADVTHLEPTEASSLLEEADLGNHATFDNGIQAQPSGYQGDGYHEASDNVYEDVENPNKFTHHNQWKRKGGLRNPYVRRHSVKEEARLNMWPRNPCKDHQSPDGVDQKEQRKRAKQRLEREKKEQREREKKENEMKKKFKVTGEEEPMYHAKVALASKVRKNDLSVKTGDIVSIIRTTNCPKGKWLARDANHKYGYISVMNVELNIKEMLELGKKAQTAGRGSNLEGDTISIGSKSSNHPMMTSSFTDDSEEWACDEEETLSPSLENQSILQPSVSAPEMSGGQANAQNVLGDASLEDLQTPAKHAALQKLAIFFQQGIPDHTDVTDSAEPTPTNAEAPSLCAVEELPYPDQDVEFADLDLLPPPPLYADF